MKCIFNCVTCLFDLALNQTISSSSQVNLVLDDGRSLGLMIRGGAEYSLGIYITGVDRGSAAECGGLKVQFMPVLPTSFHLIYFYCFFVLPWPLTVPLLRVFLFSLSFHALIVPQLFDMLILIFSFQIFKVFFVAFSLLYQVLPTLWAAANVVCEENSLVNRLQNVFMKMQKGFCVGLVRLGVRISNNHLGVKTKEVNAKSLPRYTVLCPLSDRHRCWLIKHVCILSKETSWFYLCLLWY